MGDDFQSLPVLDLSRLETDKEALLAELRHALIHVGFFYIVNHGVTKDLMDATTSKAIDFFDQDLDAKLTVDKIYSPTFLGYSTQGNEITKNKKDNREQYDFANDLPDPWSPGKPEFLRLTGPNLWPADVPGFKDTIGSFWTAAHGLAERLVSLTSEALGLGPNGLDDYVVKGQQHRAKLIKYPAVDALSPVDGTQGVGAHRDTANLITLLYQANMGGLEVQNHAGEWINAPLKEGAFIVNIGTGLEYLVHETAIATTHRVTNPPAGKGPRYSIAYFHGTRLDTVLRPANVPDEVLAQKPTNVVTDTKGFQYAQLYAEDPGTYALVNRMSSHRDVAAKFYPAVAKAHGMDLNIGNSGY
ncbi:uncharacterized protein EHS24_008336 [Apiotrichum porosum]|uniref:Fe2OG dioxygenase domain-containing protein n=1 Tax=Apiotrichum porosum TaxID=105984 RepID=A0A427XQ18_9TREE|nr:uncharacterized protein EHS24_008336 [Apiotrichum porosum]RSH80908.1 hypothetical protein EHS24_008336 [Apiotrichum porosum]